MIAGLIRRAIFSTPEKELDVQNAVEQILIGKGLQKGQDYDREVGRVKISSKEVIPDFIFPRQSLALEIKLVKSRSRVGEVIDEINADIVSYSKGYSHLIFLVYDVGQIRDEAEFRRDIELEGKIDIIIIKH